MMKWIKKNPLTLCVWMKLLYSFQFPSFFFLSSHQHPPAIQWWVVTSRDTHYIMCYVLHRLWIAGWWVKICVGVSWSSEVYWRKEVFQWLMDIARCLLLARLCDDIIEYLSIISCASAIILAWVSIDGKKYFYIYPEFDDDDDDWFISIVHIQLI